MNSQRLSFIQRLALLSLFGLVVPACSGSGGNNDDDTSPSGSPTTVEAICAKVFECFDNNWGWQSEDDCVTAWLTGCADTDGYLVCANTCVSGDCAGFALEDGTGGCEPDCWTAYCD